MHTTTVARERMTNLLFAVSIVAVVVLLAAGHVAVPEFLKGWAASAAARAHLGRP